MPLLRNVCYALILVSALSLIVTVPQPLKIIFGFLQAYVLPGLVFFAFLGDRSKTLRDKVFFTPLLSPILLSILVFGFHQLTGELDTAVRFSLGIFYVLFITTLLKGKLYSGGEPSPVPLHIYTVSSVFAGMVAITYLLNSYLLVYTDAWHHISVIHEIIDRGLPPVEPRFPDVPIRYMWFYHLFHATGTRLTGLDVKYVLGLFNIVNAFIFPYLIARLIAYFTRDRTVILASAVFGCMGLESAGWVLWPLKLLRALFGDVRGSQEIARMLGETEFNGVRVILFLKPPWTWLMNLHDKFITITAMNVTFNLFLLCFIIVVAKALTDRIEIRAGVMLFFVTLGAMLFHVVTGMALVLTVIGASMLLIIWRRIQKAQLPPVFQSLVVPGFALLALIAGLPYFLSLAGGGGGGSFIREHVHFGYINIFTILAPLLVLFPFVRAVLRKVMRCETIHFEILGMWLVCLLVIAVFLDLPGLGENKVIFPIFMLLFPFITWRIVEMLRTLSGVRRTILHIWLAVLFAVPPFLVFRGFILERPKTAHFAKRQRITDEERDIYEWIRRNTAIDAVIIERNYYHLMPVYARRKNFVLNPTMIGVHNYTGENIDRYVAVRNELFSDEPISAETIRFLRRKEMGFYVVIWREDLEQDPDLDLRFRSHPNWFEIQYENSAGTVYYVNHDNGLKQ
ncbi:MAG: hypothetical protein JSV33_14440 [bacterium]|nr:MAG: hypothetical protein JSV33_14440 [bacterium]